MVRINFVGDIMFGELIENYKSGVKTKIEKFNINPFKYCANIFKDADFNVGNLESILSNKSHYKKPFCDILRANPECVGMLRENNINILNTSNNHALDHGELAFKDSLKTLKSNNINYFGYTEDYFFQVAPVIILKSNLKIGFLGYNIANFTENNKNQNLSKINEIIKRSKLECDILVLSMHWGYEYTNIPSPKIVEMAKVFLKNGVDILYGHHSHTIQGVLKIGNRIFAPSLGNFIFDDLRKKQRITGILQITIDEKKQIDFKVLPLYINDDYQPILDNKLDKYFSEISSSLKEIYDMDRDNIEEKEKEIFQLSLIGHNENRKRLRKRMIKYFYRYFPYLHRILWKNIIMKKKYYSLINSDEFN